MLRHVALVRTDVSEELSASFIRATRIGELGKTLAVTINRRTLRRNTKYFLQDPHHVTSQKVENFNFINCLHESVYNSRAKGRRPLEDKCDWEEWATEENILGAGQDITKEMWELRKEEVHELYSLSEAIVVIELRNQKWAYHEDRAGANRMC
jgi:hypothetical protein